MAGETYVAEIEAAALVNGEDRERTITVIVQERRTHGVDQD